MSPSVNPLLTISALTERWGALIAEDHGWTINYNF
jgi:cholesterol oxidase